MSAEIIPAWDFARMSSSVKFVIEEQTGGAASFTYSSGVYAHCFLSTSLYDIYGSTTTTTVKFPNRQTDAAQGTTFINHLITAMNASGGLAGTYSLNTFAGTTGKYTIDVTGAGTGWRLGSGSDAMAGQILGMSEAGAYATSKTSDNAAWFWLASASGGISNVSDDYEAPDIAYDAETDDGNATGIAWSDPPRYYDFSVQVEAAAKVLMRSAAATTPFTFQHFWRHARNVHPFVVVIDGTYGKSTNNPSITAASQLVVCQLRADSASWRPERVNADLDDLWSVPFRTRLLARWDT
jgi:hypothetical protein